MTKILRDVREDRRNGRVYPPRDEMVFYGIRESDMAEGKVTSRWRQFMRFQIQRTRQIRKARKVNSTSGSSQKFNKPLITHWILNCSLRPME
ncbi:MAG TPA: squalene/phytoene synthase family protein [Anaerolineales bacterium]|nr:squalene/phytoene synthase family protein [Anaerolineales bacterium]